MFPDYIKDLFKKMGMSLLCMMLLGTLSFFVFNEIKEARKLRTAVLAQSSESATNNANSINSNPTNTSNAGSASTEPFQEGKHYQKLSAKITTDPLVQQFIAKDPGKIQVIEFFNYGCYWCSRLHQSVNEWDAKKPDYVTFYRFPIVFNKGWEVLAKAYFIVDTLGNHTTLDETFFKAVHKDDLDLTDEPKLQDFFEKQGVEGQKFREMYHSFAVNRALAQSNALSNAYQITASPAFIINGPSGSYLVTASMAGTEKAVLEVVGYLLDKESKQMAGK